MTQKDRAIYRGTAIALCCVALAAAYVVFWSLSFETRAMILAALSAAYSGYVLMRRGK